MSRSLQAEGHHVLCVGIELAAAMAPGFEPDEVYVPATAEGDDARTRLKSVLGRVPISSVDPEALVAAREPHGPPDVVALPKGSPKQVVSEPRPDAQRALTTPDIRSKLEQVRFGHYHAILEVTPSTSPFVVKEHFDALSRLYNPAGWPHKLTPDEVHELAEIGEALREAFAILGHSELRARYEQALSRQRHE